MRANRKIMLAAAAAMLLISPGAEAQSEVAVFNPGLDQDTTTPRADVACICVYGGQQSPFRLVVPAGHYLTDRTIMMATPFIAEVSGQIGCGTACKNGGEYRCLGGRALVTSYSPQMQTGSTNAPGYVYMVASISQVSRRDC